MMLEEIKTQFVQFLVNLGYKVGDNGTYNEEFPWLMIRTGNYQASHSRDIKMSAITLVLDVFSTYNGEKEIIDISENIIKHLPELRANKKITMVAQSGMKIMGDKTTGPVRKHGILSYQFVLASGIQEENEDGPTGD